VVRHDAAMNRMGISMPKPAKNRLATTSASSPAARAPRSRQGPAPQYAAAASAWARRFDGTSIRTKEAPSHFVAVPSQSNVRANQFPRSVSRAEPFRCFVVTVNIPSRARSAVVMPDTGLPPGAPCQAPSFLWSPPELKQANKAFRLVGDRKAIGARRSPGASSNKGAGEIISLRGAGSTALS
jgi:hypothetical protein